MTNDAPLCCDDCFEMIARKNAGAARLWMDLCNLHSTCQGVFGAVIKDENHLMLLELFGFITTTETSEVILIKINGKHSDVDGHFFCGGRCRE